MHEASLIKDLVHTIETVAAENGASKVSVVRVKLGALAHCSEEHFMEHYLQEAKGTIAQDARVEIELLSESADDPLAQEVVLESIEIEQ